MCYKCFWGWGSCKLKHSTVPPMIWSLPGIGAVLEPLTLCICLNMKHLDYAGPALRFKTKPPVQFLPSFPVGEFFFCMGQGRNAKAILWLLRLGHIWILKPLDLLQSQRAHRFWGMLVVILTVYGSPPDVREVTEAVSMSSDMEVEVFEIWTSRPGPGFSFLPHWEVTCCSFHFIFI